MRMIHSMIRVKNLEQSLKFYEEILKFTVNARFDFDGFTLVYLGDKVSQFELELTYNHGQNEPYESGTGYGHLAVTTDDLDADFERIKESGIEPTPIKEFFRDGELMARFCFVQDPDGYKIEILQKHGRYI